MHHEIPAASDEGRVLVLGVGEPAEESVFSSTCRIGDIFAKPYDMSSALYVLVDLHVEPISAPQNPFRNRFH